MSQRHVSRTPRLLALRKIGVSALVVLTFTAYVLHQNLTTFVQTNSLSASQTVSPSNLLLTARPPSPLPVAPQTLPTTIPVVPLATTQLPTDAQVIPSATPVIPTATPIDPTDTPVNQGQYRNGTYAGPEVDVIYGLVQVQISVQNGQIANVQFLDYPHDRRTSQQINSIAMPYLIQEAIQAQSAQVDVISGATLTSEGFIQSLSNAIGQAGNS